MKTSTHSRFAKLDRVPWRSLMLLTFVTLAVAAAPGQTARRIVSDNGDPILYPSYLTEFGGQLYFRANNLPHGNNVELWAFDGTVARMVADINPGANGSDPSYLAGYGDRLYFSATDEVHGYELWSFDGTTARLVLDLNAGPYGSEVAELTVFQGTLYSSADDGYVPGLSALEPQVFALALRVPVPPLRLSTPEVLAGSELRLTLKNSDEIPITSDQLARIQVFTSPNAADPLSQWQRLSNALVLEDGSAQVSGLNATNAAGGFFQAVTTPQRQGCVLAFQLPDTPSKAIIAVNSACEPG